MTSAGFGAAGLTTLYITSASIGLSAQALQLAPLTGQLFALEVDVPGVATPRFGELTT